MWYWLWVALEVLSVPVLGSAIALVLLMVGVVGLVLWAGRSLNRDLERRDWKNVGRW